MRIKQHRIGLNIVLYIFSILCGCSGPASIYIDLKKQAIVSCDNVGLRKIKIENDSNVVNLEGTEPIIYFGKKNNARTTIYGTVVYNYVLKLKPNSNYIITKYNGYDRGPFRMTFETDGSGKVIKASNENCN